MLSVNTQTVHLCVFGKLCQVLHTLSFSCIKCWPIRPPCVFVYLICPRPSVVVASGSWAINVLMFQRWRVKGYLCILRLYNLLYLPKLSIYILNFMLFKMFILRLSQNWPTRNTPIIFPVRNTTDMLIVSLRLDIFSYFKF